MEYAEVPAPPEWGDWIHCFWYLQGPGGDGPAPVVPDGRAEIVVHLGEPFSVEVDGRRQRQGEVMVSGQLTRPLQLVPSYAPAVAGIRLTTAGASAVVPVNELTDRVVPLGDVVPALATSLLDAFASRRLSIAVLRRAAAVLADAAARRPTRLAWDAVRALEAPAPPSLARLASAARVSLRTLQRRFREEIGIDPRLLRRIVRFRRAFRLLSRPGAATGAAVAAQTGYFDQAHLVRDFRRFAGLSPRRFFRANPSLASAFLAGETE